MATKRSSGPAKKTPRTRKKTAVEAVVETPVAAAPIEPIVLASETVASVNEPKPEPSDDEIRRRAYNYWVQGNPDPIANWFRAVNELKQH
jgi:hypothetical protein